MDSRSRRRKRLFLLCVFGSPYLSTWVQYVLDGPPGNTYLGYSVESSCLARTFIPPDERERRAYILAKSLDYVHRTGDRAWPQHFYEDASNTTGIQFLLGADDDGSHPNLPPGMVNLGQMPQAEFLATVAKSRVLIGVGNPLTCANYFIAFAYFDR